MVFGFLRAEMTVPTTRSQLYVTPQEGTQAAFCASAPARMRAQWVFSVLFCIEHLRHLTYIVLAILETTAFARLEILGGMLAKGATMATRTEIEMRARDVLLHGKCYLGELDGRSAPHEITAGTRRRLAAMAWMPSEGGGAFWRVGQPDECRFSIAAADMPSSSLMLSVALLTPPGVIASRWLVFETPGEFAV